MFINFDKLFEKYGYPYIVDLKVLKQHFRKKQKEDFEVFDSIVNMFSNKF